MSRIPNEFNPYGDYTVNHNGFVPIQTNQNLRNHQSKMVPSIFVTSTITNHTNLFSPSPSYTCYHDSQISSSSLRITNSCVAYQMRSNMISPFSMPCTAQISDFVRVSKATQTITNRYHAIVPTNNMVTVQNDNERVKRVISSNPNISNSTSHPPNIFDKHYETFSPKPINYFCSQEDSTSRRPVKKIREAIDFLTEIDDYINYEEGEIIEDDENVGWIHNLPYEKDGSFICLKCDNLFDTLQILVAHTQLVHCRSETNNEKKKRLEVNHHEVHGKSQKINKDQTGGQSCRTKLRQ